MTDRMSDPNVDPEHEDTTGDEFTNGDTLPADTSDARGETRETAWAPLADPQGVSSTDDSLSAVEQTLAEPDSNVADDVMEVPAAADSDVDNNEPSRALPPPVPDPFSMSSGDDAAAGPVVDPATVDAERVDPGDDFVPLATPVTTTGSPNGPEAVDEATGPESDQSGETNSQPEDATVAASATGGGFLGGLKARFQAIGSGSGKPTPEPDLAAEPAQSARASWSTRMGNALRGYFDPRLAQYTTRPHRWLLGVSAIVILMSLLAGSGGLALVMLSVIAPLLIVITLTQRDVFEQESNLFVAGVIAAGAVAGIVIGGIASWIQGEQWFDTGKLNFGAGGFGGPFADAAGSLPVAVWLVSGALLGAVGTAAIGGAAVALRQLAEFRNEAMDSVTIGGAAAAGYAIGLSLVYWWPMVGDPGPVTSVQDWTLRIIGVGILRPAAFTLCGALLGFGVWLYATNRSFSMAALPAMMGGLGMLLLNVTPATLQASGAWSEIIVTAVLFAVTFPAYRFALDSAIAIDRKPLGNDGTRIVCPACHEITPIGEYCGHCGQRLGAAEEPAVATKPKA